MEFRSYNAELALANMMFKNIFSNIIINKTDSKGNVMPIAVNCQLAQRSRIFKSWQNAERRAKMKLPMIAISRTGYSRNPQRLNNLHNEVKYELSSKNRIYELLTPIPIDISYDVSVMSKNVSDIDQIATNFMVFFNSDIYVTCEHPKYAGMKLNNQIIMSDSISEEHPDELDALVDDLITTTFQFTFKTYLFGGTTQCSKVSNGSSETEYDGFIPIIKHIDGNFWYPIPDKVNDYDAYTDFVDDMPKPYKFRDELIWKIDTNLSA